MKLLCFNNTALTEKEVCMPRPPDSNKSRVELRRRAEAILRKAGKNISPLSPEEFPDILHELQVYQTELEMQNEELRLKQADLEEARDLYFDLYELAPVGYLNLDLKGLTVRANLTVSKMLGLDRNAFCRRLFSSFMDKESESAYRTFRQALNDTDYRQTCEVKLSPVKGSAIHARLEGTPEVDSGGILCGYRLAVIDITKQKKAEDARTEALAQTRRREMEVRALLDGSQKVQTTDDFETAARYVFDICTTVFNTSAGFVSLFSEDRKEHQLLFMDPGAPAKAMTPGPVMPDSGLLAKCYQTGQTVYANYFAKSQWQKFLPPGHVTLDNALFAPLNVEGQTVGIMCLANKPAGFSEEDAILAGAFGSIVALALQKIRLMNGLMNSEERFRELFGNMSTGVAVYEMQDEGERFIFRHVNPAGLRIGKYEQEQVIGREVRQVFPGVEDMGLLKVFQRVWRTGRAERHPLVLYKDERISFWVENYIFKLPNGELVAMYEDLTQQKMAEEQRQAMEIQLRQAQKMEAVGTLAGGIAHEFNNALAVIMGYGEIAREKSKHGEDASDEIGKILQRTEHAADLIKRILTFTRATKSNAKPLDLNNIVTRSAVLLRDTLPRMIDLQTVLDEKISMIQGETVQIEQVIINLATNARDAMPNGGLLLFKTSAVKVKDLVCNCCSTAFSGDYVQLQIKDSGIGMERETLEKSFDPFFTTKEIGKGTGLGLSMVLGIVRGHSGHIIYHSEVGQGTIFNLYFPVVTADVETMVPEATVAGDITGGSETILLVDDEKALRELGCEMFAKAGYKTIVAGSGEDALGIYQKRSADIDLIILDISMPGMGGHRCLKEVLKINPEAKVIISSGYSRSGHLRNTIDSGASGYIAKPFKFEELFRKVREVLDG
jgi:PAS domain S-box-containing protein